MKNKRMIQWLVIGVGLITILVMTLMFRQNESKAVCKGIKVELGEDQTFISKAEVWEYLQDSMGTITGVPLTQISLARVEDVIETIPYVKSAEAYTDLDELIHIRIRQRNPIVRIQPNHGKPYYIDEEGIRFPLSPHYTSRVVIATGDIDSSMSRKIYTLAHDVNRLPFWKAQIEQIFVGEAGDLILVEKFGDHRIIVGDGTQLDEKLARVMVFYEKTLIPRGWSHFRSINAKYKNQIICK